MNRLLSRLALPALALVAMFAAAPVMAAPITYNLTLTAQITNFGGGTGSFSIDGNDYTGVSNEFFTAGNVAKTLLSIAFDIDGKHFDLSDDTGNSAQVFFQNGVVAGVQYQAIDGGDILISLNAGALSYIYNDYHTGRYSIGTVSAALSAAPTSVPEPLTLALLGAGLIGLGIARRRKAAA